MKTITNIFQILVLRLTSLSRFRLLTVCISSILGNQLRNISEVLSSVYFRILKAKLSSIRLHTQTAFFIWLVHTLNMLWPRLLLILPCIGGCCAVSRKDALFLLLTTWLSVFWFLRTGKVSFTSKGANTLRVGLWASSHTTKLMIVIIDLEVNGNHYVIFFLSSVS